MKRFIYAIIASAFIGSPSVGAMNVSEAEKSVVRVFTGQGTGSGSGSVVARGYVLTNHHVIADESDIQVASKHLRNPLQATVVWQSQGLDLALLKVSGLALPSLIVRIGKLNKGEKVWALGYPGVSDTDDEFILEATATDGVISLIKRDTWHPPTKLTMIQHSAKINPGHSGGPLLDDCGRQIGVNTSGVDGPGINVVFLASHIKEAIPHLKSKGVNPRINNSPCVASAATPSAVPATTPPAASQSAANWDVRIGILIALIIAVCALLLALKGPRQKIIQAVEAMSEVIRTNKTRRQTRKAARASRKSSPAIKSALFLTGFDARGNRVKIGVPQNGADEKHGGFVIGRQADVVDAPIEDASISRRHVRLFYENHTYKIEDVNSANGTKLNGKPIAPFARIEFKVGAMITLGKIDLQTSKGDA